MAQDGAGGGGVVLVQHFTQTSISRELTCSEPVACSQTPAPNEHSKEGVQNAQLLLAGWAEEL